MAVDKNTVTKDAAKFAAKGQFDKAIAEWKKLVKENPDDASIYNTIGDLCLKKDAKADAVDAYKTAADLLASDGFSSKATALYKKILNIDPKKIEVHLALADLNAEKGLTGNALESYKVVVDHYILNNQMTEALGIYQKMADLNPSNIAFRLKLADMYAKASMKQEATKTYLEAADVQIEKGANQEARQIFEKILAIDPGNKQVYYKAGIVYYKEGKFVEACKAFKPAMEADPSNQELLETYLDALSKAGRSAEAEDIYKKLLSQDPGRIDLREKLFQIYFTKKDFSKALQEASFIVDVRLQNNEAEAAELFLKELVAAAPKFAAARLKLAELYVTLELPSEAGKEFIKAADIHIAEGKPEDAKEVLTRALDISPDLPEAVQRLANLAPPSAPEPEAAIPMPEPVPEPGIEEPIVPAQVVPEPAPVVVEAAPVIAAVVAPPEPAPVAEVAPPPVEVPSPEPVAAAQPTEEDLVIAKEFTEIDVLIKYGLTPKAMEHLEGMAKKHPDNPQVRIRLRNLYGDIGNMGKAAAHAIVLADIYTKLGQPDKGETELRSALEMDPNNKEIRALLGMTVQEEPAAPAVAEIPVVEEAAVFKPSSLEPVREEAAPPPHEMPSLEMPSGIELAPAQEEIPATGPDLNGEIQFDGLDTTLPSLKEAVPEQPVAAAPVEAEKPTAPPVREKQPAEIKQPTPRQEAPPQPPVEQIDLGEVWAEAEFYFQQGLFDEARKHYDKILEHTPTDERVLARIHEISREQEDTQEFSKLAEAVEGLEGMVPAEMGGADVAMSTSVSDDEAVRMLMEEIQSLKQKPPVPPPPPVAEPVAPPARKKTPPKAPPPAVEPSAPPAARKAPLSAAEPSAPPPVQKAPLKAPAPPVAPEPVRAVKPPVPVARPSDDEDFFDLGAELRDDEEQIAAPKKEAASDDFFDLAAELRDDLGSISVPGHSGVTAEEQSLDDIFEDFKKGVKQQEVKQDLDTHYNLGVAYKELGLLDDAIAEFIVTPEGEPKFIQSRHMLGLCYMETDEYHKAIAEIRNALNYSESLGGDKEERIGMHYDLGLAYQGAGNVAEALKEFQHVHDQDPEYRDTVAKLKELRKGGFISLDQLKDDIEKEISSKFLEEGERIEREEKTRKNEKVRK